MHFQQIKNKSNATSLKSKNCTLIMAHQGYQYIAATDYFSRYTEIAMLYPVITECNIGKFKNFFSRCGIIIEFDNNNREIILNLRFQRLCRQLWI